MSTSDLHRHLVARIAGIKTACRNAQLHELIEFKIIASVGSTALTTLQLSPSQHDNKIVSPQGCTNGGATRLLGGLYDARVDL